MVSSEHHDDPPFSVGASASSLTFLAASFAFYPPSNSLTSFSKSSPFTSPSRKKGALLGVVKKAKAPRPRRWMRRARWNSGPVWPRKELWQCEKEKKPFLHSFHFTCHAHFGVVGFDVQRIGWVGSRIRGFLMLE
ncbi:hypothetical protein MUK42_25026 [Musa troglodytarum]|uniref:Uncharacterized protein n=1 Tax=Musa troglodytarum TaxID=320322 RepID=A0A9E7JSJ1_9LILI|nr:hypothetical protein MUK42_25026 [Musa troglodytarum]